jgi:transposase
VTRIICGVDVSSISLEAFVGPAGPARSFANTAEGIAELAVFCQEHQVELVAMEATGGYEKQALVLLWSQGVAVTLLNARAVRDFAKGMGLLEKTDRIDAQIIARFAEVKGSRPSVPRTAPEEHLKALVTHLRQLTQMHVSQRNQGLLVTDKAVQRSMAKVLKVLERQKREVAAKITAVLASDPLWQELDQTFRSIKGVADRTVAAVIADLPEIGTLSNKAAAKLAGLAPLAQDSGKKQGKRPVRGGRRQLRAVLFVVAGVVARHNPDFAAFQRRLSADGKPKRVIRVALAHKLLVRLNAKARDVRMKFTSVDAPQIA